MSDYLPKADTITLEPVLRLPNIKLPFKVQIDALDKALRVVVVQERHSGASERQKSNAKEQRYSTHEKDMIAIINFLETWKHYLRPPSSW